VEQGEEAVADEQPHVETLGTGEKVTVYPDGRQVLISANSLAAGLNSAYTDQVTASAALTDAALAAVEEKRARQQDGASVPSDKSPL
jgi:hypothetical protein